MYRYLLDVVSGKRDNFKDRAVLVILSFLEIIYRIVLKIRDLLFKFEIIKTNSLPCRVISIGNITTGGTGKTPAVERLAGILRRRNTRVVVVSRGYGGENKDPLIVSDGEELLVGVEKAGDEVYMLARHLDNVPVIICKDRYRAGLLAVEEFAPDVIILDDGFQHQKLERDLDIVTLNALNPFGYGHVLPRGLLREPLTALRRADVFIITREDQVSEKKIRALKNKLRKYNRKATIYTSRYQSLYLKLLTEEREKKYSLGKLKDRKVLALSGIGNPDSFVRSLKDLKAEIIDSFVFPDHYEYKEEDIMDISVKAQLSDADWVITTDKDAVKFSREMLQQFRKLDVGIYTLIIKLVVNERSDFIRRVI